MKRKWLMVPLVTGLLAAGITGASVLAHNDDGEQESPKDKVATKVAEILGIEDTQSVIDALTEARQEVQSERVEHRLADLVEAGRLTPEQADAYLEWHEARPDVPKLHNKGHRLFGFRSGGEGEEGRPGHRFGQGESRGQQFGDLRSRFGQGLDGQNLPNLDDLRSAFEERFGSGNFPGRGGEAPEASVTTY